MEWVALGCAIVAIAVAALLRSYDAHERLDVAVQRASGMDQRMDRFSERFYRAVDEIAAVSLRVTELEKADDAKVVNITTKIDAAKFDDALNAARDKIANTIRRNTVARTTPKRKRSA